MVIVVPEQVPIVRRSCRMRAHVVHTRIFRGAPVRAGHKECVVWIIEQHVVTLGLLQARVERDRVHDAVALPVLVNPAMRPVAGPKGRVADIISCRSGKTTPPRKQDGLPRHSPT